MSFYRTFYRNGRIRNLIKFEDYIDTVVLVYNFKGPPHQPIQLISNKNRILLPLVAVLSCYEGLKAIYHGVVDNDLYRLYTCDLICTYTKFQYIFDLSACVSYFYVTRFGFKMMAISRDETRLNKWQYMEFLKYDANELTNNYVINRKEAKDFLKLVDFMIRIARINVIFLYTFCFSLHARVLYNALITLSANMFIFSTVPNFISFYLVFLTSYQSLNCFFSIYLLTCTLISKSIKTLTNQNFTRPFKRSDKLAFINLNLKAFNQIIKLQESCQKDIDLNLATLFSMMAVVGFAFPYVIICGLRYSFVSFVYLFIYVNGLSFSLGAIAFANGLVRNSLEAYRSFLFKFIPNCPFLSHKIKLENFFNIDQKAYLMISFRFHSLLHYNNSFILKYLLESSSIVMLIYSLLNKVK